MAGRKKQVVHDELIQDDVQLESHPQLDAIKSTVMPVTLEGKAVNRIINGKVRIYNFRTNKFITGFIESNLAIQAVGKNDHLKIVQNGEEV